METQTIADNARNAELFHLISELLTRAEMDRSNPLTMEERNQIQQFRTYIFIKHEFNMLDDLEDAGLKPARMFL